jgi:hypothetical protein
VASAEEPWITEPPAKGPQVENTSIGEHSGSKASNGSLASRSLAVIAALMLTIGGVFTVRDYARSLSRYLVRLGNYHVNALETATAGVAFAFQQLSSAIYGRD